MNIRLLYLTSDTCPAFRADVAVLFGTVLPRYGILSDIVAGKTPGVVEAATWGGGDAYLCNVSGGSARKHIKTFLHVVRHLLSADARRYQATRCATCRCLRQSGCWWRSSQGAEILLLDVLPYAE